MSALTSVNIDYLLTKQNSDLDTYISKVFSDDGIELSGGEKQRLALARIFLKIMESLFLMNLLQCWMHYLKIIY